jgi:genome maintenance exonuclease 1
MHKTFNHELVLLPDLVTETIDGKRYYLGAKGKKLPSVTSVLGAFYGDWVKEWRARVGEEVANKISAQASRRGTAIHKICEDYIMNKSSYLEDHVPVNIDMFNSMRPELHRINNVYSVEAPLFSETIGVAGRVDCIAHFDGYPSIIDYKTSKKLKNVEDIENYFVQMTLYSLMFEDMTNIKCKQLVVIMGVDHENPLVFIKQRADFVKKAHEVVSSFYKNNQLPI